MVPELGALDATALRATEPASLQRDLERLTRAFQNLSSVVLNRKGPVNPVASRPPSAAGGSRPRPERADCVRPAAGVTVFMHHS